MHKEYILMQTIKTIGTRNPYKLIDKLQALNFGEAEKDLMTRNNFQKLLVKGDLTILQAIKYYQ